MSRFSLCIGLLLAAACAADPPPAPTPPPRAAAPVPPPRPVDPLGPLPTVPAPAAYVPPVPETFTTKNGITVWLLERHALPYVSMALTVPSGASSDAKNEGGLALAAADMLDEGAGSRGAIELSRAIDSLGASLGTTANHDQSRVSLSVLKKNLTPAFAIFADVIVRPRFEADEWKRLHEILVNDLTERLSDPDEVAKVVMRRVLFGDAHPYGHPVEGTLASAKTWSLGDVQHFYKEAWRPDRATLIVVGDVTHAEIAALVEGPLGSWQSPKSPAPAPVSPAAPSGPWPKMVLVDRPDAPQSVISVSRTGMRADDPSIVVAMRANVALGGGFTSRLNQDLREEHGYSYGASSRFGWSRGVGAFVANASVMTDKTADALKAMLGDINFFSKNGLTDAEVQKTRSQARGELVETFEGTDAAVAQLASDAALGLGPDYERTMAVRRDTASKPDLDALARAQFDTTSAIIVVVGPRAQLEGPIHALGFSDIEFRDPEGNLVPKAVKIGASAALGAAPSVPVTPAKKP